MYHQVERELALAKHPPTALDTCDCIEDNLLGCILSPLSSAELRCALQARLRDLPAFVSQLPALDAASAWQCEPASTHLAELALSLKQIFRSWQQQFEKLIQPLEADFDQALRSLDALARKWREEVHANSEALGPEAAAQAWRDYCDTDLDSEALAAKLEAEVQRTIRELEKRATTLHQRYEKQTPGGSESVHYVLQQIATDQPRPEHWLECQRNILAELKRNLESRKLPIPLESSIALGLGSRAARQDVCCHAPLKGEPSLLVFDLATLPASERPTYLDDHNSYELQLLLAREGLPGRLSLLHERRSTQGLAACLLRASDLDAWAFEVPELLGRLGWMQGEARVRILLLRDRLRVLLSALADLELHTLRRPEIELFRRLRREGMLNAGRTSALFAEMRRYPMRQASQVHRWLVLHEELRKFKRRAGSSCSPADIWQAARRWCDLPPGVLRKGLATEEPQGLSMQEPPPPVIQLGSARKDELIESVESQLAALGRIRSEDLDAGSEFDAPGATQPHTEADSVATSASSDEAQSAIEAADPAAQADPDAKPEEGATPSAT